MTNKEAMNLISKNKSVFQYDTEMTKALDLAIKALESRQQGEWIPIKTRKLTEEEKEEYPDSEFMYDCKLPDDGEEVLITTFAGNVTLDTFCRDDGCYFESYCDENDVIAWQPLPEPYKKGEKKMRLSDFIMSTRCEFCNEPLINQKAYIARESITSGLSTIGSYTEPALYDAVDCPRCGKQHIIGERKRFYFSEECIAEDPEEEEEAENE